MHKEPSSHEKLGKKLGIAIESASIPLTEKEIQRIVNLLDEHKYIKLYDTVQETYNNHCIFIQSQSIPLLAPRTAKKIDFITKIFGSDRIPYFQYLIARMDAVKNENIAQLIDNIFGVDDISKYTSNCVSTQVLEIPKNDDFFTYGRLLVDVDINSLSTWISNIANDLRTNDQLKVHLKEYFKQLKISYDCNDPDFLNDYIQDKKFNEDQTTPTIQELPKKLIEHHKRKLEEVCTGILHIDANQPRDKSELIALKNENDKMHSFVSKLNLIFMQLLTTKYTAAFTSNGSYFYINKTTFEKLNLKQHQAPVHKPEESQDAYPISLDEFCKLISAYHEYRQTDEAILNQTVDIAQVFKQENWEAAQKTLATSVNLIRKQLSNNKNTVFSYKKHEDDYNKLKTTLEEKYPTDENKSNNTNAYNLLESVQTSARKLFSPDRSSKTKKSEFTVREIIQSIGDYVPSYNQKVMPQDLLSQKIQKKYEEELNHLVDNHWWTIFSKNADKKLVKEKKTKLEDLEKAIQKHHTNIDQEFIQPLQEHYQLRIAKTKILSSYRGNMFELKEDLNWLKTELEEEIINEYLSNTTQTLEEHKIKKAVKKALDSKNIYTFDQQSVDGITALFKNKITTKKIIIAEILKVQDDIFSSMRESIPSFYKQFVDDPFQIHSINKLYCKDEIYLKNVKGQLDEFQTLIATVIKDYFNLDIFTTTEQIDKQKQLDYEDIKLKLQEKLKDNTDSDKKIVEFNEKCQKTYQDLSSEHKQYIDKNGGEDCIRSFLFRIREIHLQQVSNSNIFKQLQKYCMTQLKKSDVHPGKYSNMQVIKRLEKSYDNARISEEYVDTTLQSHLETYINIHSYQYYQVNAQPTQTPQPTQSNIQNMEESPVKPTNTNSGSGSNITASNIQQQTAQKTEVSYVAVIMEAIFDIIIVALTFIFLLPITPFIALASTSIGLNIWTQLNPSSKAMNKPKSSNEFEERTQKTWEQASDYKAFFIEKIGAIIDLVIDLKKLPCNNKYPLSYLIRSFHTENSNKDIDYDIIDKTLRKITGGLSDAARKDREHSSSTTLELLGNPTIDRLESTINSYIVCQFIKTFLKIPGQDSSIKDEEDISPYLKENPLNLLTDSINNNGDDGLNLEAILAGDDSDPKYVIDTVKNIVTNLKCVKENQSQNPKTHNNLVDMA
ncbi:MAG TPA: hypothetical protein QF353_00800 [Gammaproteobacteria bacterium]|nr:hypothetical protein [Gammaproteobacteria bacterium]